MIKKIINVFLFIAVVLVLTSGCCRPLLYKPSPCNLNPVLSLQLPEQIDTLSRCPRNETNVEMGRNKLTGNRQPNEIKEMFNFNKDNAEYRFTLYLNTNAPMQGYESHKHFTSERIPVFQEINTPDYNFCLHYIDRPRSDPEGLCVPMGYYVWKATFRLRNILIEIETHDDSLESNSLNKAIKELAVILNEALQKNNSL